MYCLLYNIFNFKQIVLIWSFFTHYNIYVKCFFVFLWNPYQKFAFLFILGSEGSTWISINLRFACWICQMCILNSKSVDLFGFLSILGWHIMIRWGKTDFSGCDVKTINLRKDGGKTESVEISKVSDFDTCSHHKSHALFVSTRKTFVRKGLCFPTMSLQLRFGRWEFIVISKLHVPPSFFLTI